MIAKIHLNRNRLRNGLPLGDEDVVGGIGFVHLHAFAGINGLISILPAYEFIAIGDFKIFNVRNTENGVLPVVEDRHNMICRLIAHRIVGAIRDAGRCSLVCPLSIEGNGALLHDVARDCQLSTGVVRVPFAILLRVPADEDLAVGGAQSVGGLNICIAVLGVGLAVGDYTVTVGGIVRYLNARFGYEVRVEIEITGNRRVHVVGR